MQVKRKRKVPEVVVDQEDPGPMVVVPKEVGEVGDPMRVEAVEALRKMVVVAGVVCSMAAEAVVVPLLVEVVAVVI